jgi:enoyl-[acyl-carrier protein] reductase I
MLVDNKNIIVMGVANKWSIAWGIAKELLENDANVIFTYHENRNKVAIEKLLETGGFENYFLVKLDVSLDDDYDIAFKEIKEKYQVVNGLVHSVAFAKKEELMGNYYDTSREGFLLSQNISSYSFVKASKYASELMDNDGQIVCLTYLGGERVVINYNVMGVAKASLEASVKYLAHDFGKKNIRVNAISSGPIKTISAKGVGEFSKLLDGFLAKAPMGRLVTHKDLGNTALYLLSDLSSGVTGENIHVDCGYSVLGY